MKPLSEVAPGLFSFISWPRQCALAHQWCHPTWPICKDNCIKIRASRSLSIDCMWLGLLSVWLSNCQWHEITPWKYISVAKLDSIWGRNKPVWNLRSLGHLHPSFILRFTNFSRCFFLLQLSGLWDIFIPYWIYYVQFVHSGLCDIFKL